ncbi:hypothetical protein PQX77_009140 [Marasmius sp. AFHP31]|nr:hypothetical protein PQX77_009140 [Marasmius sp. AFHP31]
MFSSRLVYSFGSAEASQLGHGSTGGRITTSNETAFDVEECATLICTLLPVRVTSIACGNQHTIALTSEGPIYVWGYGGYCRLGLANRVHQLRPKLVEQLPDEAQKKDDKEGSASEPPVRTGTARFIAAGPSTSAVVDEGGMFYLAGKRKQTTTESSGSPYTTFRYLGDIMHMACKISTPADSDLDPVAHPNAPRMVVA